MINRTIILIFIFFSLISCAQVPKESVELSTTLGRDLAAVQKSHRELATVLFSRMREDINRFVDEVYAPFQIKYVMDRQAELAKSSDPDDREGSLLFAINEAFKPDSSSELQDAVLKGMESMITNIRSDIESMRKELLDPLEGQESEVLSSIDQSYQQLHYANSIVTGYLSSVAKVHDTQVDLLEKVGVDQDQLGGDLARTSEKIRSLVEKSQKAEKKGELLLENTEKLKNAIKELKSKLNINKDEEE